MKYSEDFKKFPQELSDSYDAVQSIASRVLTEEEFLAWEESGLNIANKGSRAWESAVEYFRATPDILNKLPFVGCMYLLYQMTSNLSRNTQCPHPLCLPLRYH